MSEKRHLSQERAALVKQYPGKKWVSKVLAMTDDEVREAYASMMKGSEKVLNEPGKSPD